MSDRQITPSLKHLLISLCLLVCVTSCSLPQRVTAAERMFRDFSLEFVDRYEIPKTSFENTQVGGLSAIAYEPQQDKFYVLSDDRSRVSPARFYTFQLQLNSDDLAPKIVSFEPEAVTILKDQQGAYSPGSIDPEGLTLSPRGTLYISSEGNPTLDLAPSIAEYSLAGQKIADLKIPQRYLRGEDSAQPQGIRENLAFESLTINRVGLPEDPFRLFTATESALLQDGTTDPNERAKIRFLHYIINPVGDPVLLAEHLYLLDSAPIEVISNGLTELLALPTEGYFLSLERTFGFTGAGAKIFQMVIGNATDTSNIDSLQGDTAQVRPLNKKLLLDLKKLGLYLDNLEGMTIGPRLPDGSRSLVLISDDNFNEEQVSQLLLFRLLENRS